MKTTSRFALVAAAGLMMGAWSLSAKAADLGGDCCADLEERVAELEATTVRKGNRKVSLELSGQVNKALLAWDDGRDSDVYVVDNNYSSTRFRLRGTGQMAPGWKAGFYMEYEFRDGSSNLVDQADSRNRNFENALRIRQENVFVESATLGRVTVGFQSTAAKDITLINLGGGLSDAFNLFASNFSVRDANAGTTTKVTGGGVTGNSVIGNASRLSWSNIIDTLDTARTQAIRYDTPTLYGFIVSASWGDNDFYDVALRFQKEWNSIRIAAGIGYANISDSRNLPGNGYSVAARADQVLTDNNQVGVPSGPTSKYELLIGSASAIHIPTGLYASFAAGEREIINPANADVKDASFFYIQAGITKRFFDVGATTFYGEYGEFYDYAAGANYGSVDAAGVATGGVQGRVASSDGRRIGFGFTQAFDGAALELYANYYNLSADIELTNGARTAPEDLDIVLTGARIKF